MSNDRLPELGGDGSISNRAKSLLPWLPDPYECPECSRLCDADHTYSPQEAAFHPGGMVPSWYCKECDTHYRRVEPWHE